MAQNDYLRGSRWYEEDPEYGMMEEEEPSGDRMDVRNPNRFERIFGSIDPIQQSPGDYGQSLENWGPILSGLGVEPEIYPMYGHPSGAPGESEGGMDEKFRRMQQFALIEALARGGGNLFWGDDDIMSPQRSYGPTT